MAIKHVTAKHYKENIEIKEKKLNDASVTSKQKEVIQQDLDKLKEKHNKHLDAIERNFEEQIKAALTEMRKELEKEREAFKSKYVAKEDKAQTEATEENNNTGATEEGVEKIKEAITSGKYYGFNNLTVQKFAEAKNIDIKNLSLDKQQTVFDFYGGNKEYIWIDSNDKTTKCKKAICEKITEIDDISKVISYEILSINQKNNSYCYNNDDSYRVTFGEESTSMSYWEKYCSDILKIEGVSTI